MSCLLCILPSVRGRLLTRAREWGSELCAREGGKICPPANSAPMKARITKLLWKVVWLKISMACNFGDPRSISSMSNKVKFQKFRIFCRKFRPSVFNPRLTGGGGYFPPLVFRDIFRSYKRIIVKFSVPSCPSIWHILTKGKLARTDDTSAISDVRVTSCFAGFGQK